MRHTVDSDHMPLLALFPFLRLITGRVWVYLALIAMASSFVGGWYVANKFHKAAEVAAVNAARVAERDAATIGNRHETEYLAKLRDQKRKSDAKIRNLQQRLAAAPTCSVPVPVDWLRGGADVPGPAGDAGSASGAPAAMDTAAEPVADARDVVLTCERNRLEVTEPNAEQLKAVQAWYKDLRKRMNRGL